MFRTVITVTLLVSLSIVMAGCATGDRAVKTSATGAAKKPAEYILPRIDPKKEKGIVEPGTDVAASVTVRNQTTSKISMVWLEEDTNDRIHYHDIKPGAEVSQDTWGGHYWLILDKDGKALGIYKTPDRDGVIVVK